MKTTEKSFTSFLPFGSPNPKIVIMGTAPGGKSLGDQKYYADPTNFFWEIIADIYNNGNPIREKDKEEILIKNGIALWDIYGTGTRKGSADKNIKNVEVRDIESFLNNYQNIEKIVFNGKKANEEFEKKNISGYDTMVVLSTSGRNLLNYSKEEIFDSWRKCLC